MKAGDEFLLRAANLSLFARITNVLRNIISIFAASNENLRQ